MRDVLDNCCNNAQQLSSPFGCRVYRFEVLNGRGLKARLIQDETGVRLSADAGFHRIDPTGRLGYALMQKVGPGNLLR